MQDDPRMVAAGRPAGAGTGRGRDAGRGLTLHAGRAVHPVLRLWDGGLALPAAAGADLRGRVDIYDGPRHLFHALIVASAEDGAEDEVRCSFKRITPADARPPRDYSDTDRFGDGADAIG